MPLVRPGTRGSWLVSKRSTNIPAGKKKSLGARRLPARPSLRVAGPLGLLRISRFLQSARRLLTSDFQSHAQAHVPLADIATRLPDLLTSTSKGKIYIRPGD